ncbi:hypothetical protein [Metabacillus idriensis]|uniref:hypothetical protein n=1 Tax=Metabacillus idriensis TaxID=324768 RepID=UPI001748737D|nr:hypothetical protein [Metabacillus idriensis]
MDVNVVAGIAIIVFLCYVGGRYILSGIEYTMISTEKEYKKERKIIVLKAAGFIAISLAIFSIFIEVPTRFEEWIETFGFLVLAGFFMFFTSYISLKRSFQRNKDLQDDSE